MAPTLREYHRRLFTAMGLDRRAKVVVHVGGSHKDPERALIQAERNFARLTLGSSGACHRRSKMGHNGRSENPQYRR